MFKYLLSLPSGAPPDPAVFVTAVPNWSVGEIITLGRLEQLRVIAISEDVPDELAEQGIRAIFTVEPA